MGASLKQKNNDKFFMPLYSILVGIVLITSENAKMSTSETVYCFFLSYLNVMCFRKFLKSNIWAAKWIEQKTKN